MKRGRIIGVAAGAVLLLLLLRGCGTSEPQEPMVFVVSTAYGTADIKEKFTTHEATKDRRLLGLVLLLHGGAWRIDAGGYRISPEMSTWAVASALVGDPPLQWVTIPEGLRKEQIADRLKDKFHWDIAERDAFLNASVVKPYDLQEGYLFPDTYLIPTDETPAQMHQRFINRFNEQFEPYFQPLRDANIKYDTAVKLASIIQREAAGTHDMPLIAGILWNRLEITMKLEVDATLQYARGDVGDGYWAPITPAGKAIDSPYNTYMYSGLPPQPISNPGIAAIGAVLNSEETDCLFYLHAPDRSIHCSVDYAGHLENIETYLRN